MVHRMRTMLALRLVLSLAAAHGVAQDPPDPPAGPDPDGGDAQPATDTLDLPPLTNEQLEDLCNRLGSNDPERRDDAWRQLVDAGDSALPWLRKAASRENLEIRWRARKALELVEWGVTTRLPGVSDSLKSFLVADSRIRIRQVEVWMQQYGQELLPFLRKICLQDPDRAVRERVFALIATLGASADVLIELAEHCVEQDSGATWAWRALARIYHEGGRDPEAIRWLERVLETDPSDYASHSMLADIHTEHGAIDAAIAHHLAARDLAGPGQRLVHVQALATLYVRKGDRQSAGEALEALAREDTRNPEPVLMLLRFWFDADMVEKADKLATKCLEEWPRDRVLGDSVDRLLDLMIRAWWNRGDYQRLAPLIENWRTNLANGGMGGDSLWMVAMHAWAEIRAGKPDAAATIISDYADDSGEDANELGGLLELARHFNLPDAEAHIRKVGEELPENRFMLAEAWHALQRRDAARAAELLDTVHKVMTRDGHTLRFDQLAELLPLADAIGNESFTADLIEQLGRSPAFSPASAASFSGRLTRAATVIALYRAAWKGGEKQEEDIDAALGYANELARFGHVDEAIGLIKRLIESETPGSWRTRYLKDSLAGCYVAAGKLNEARQLREEQLADSRNTSTFSGLYSLEIAAGRIERARKLAEEAMRELPSDTTRMQLLEHLLRDREYDRVLQELTDHPPTDPNMRRRGLLLEARARMVTMDFPGAQLALNRLLAAFTESGMMRTEEFECSLLLCMMGLQARVRSRFAGNDRQSDRPAPDIRGRDARDSNMTHYAFLRLASDAFARESSDDAVGALDTWLRAWRVSVLDYHSRMVRSRLTDLATTERLAEVRKQMDAEMTRIFGAGVVDGDLTWMRHNSRNALLTYVHLRALQGDDAVARKILRRLVDDGLSNDLEFLQVVLPNDPSEMRGYATQDTADVAIELMELLLRPEALPGMPAGSPPPTGEQAAARATEAWSLAARVLDRFPNELRAAVLLEEAAGRCGRTDDPRTVAVRKRLAANDPLDLLPMYVTAFHFLMHGWPELAIPSWKHMLAMPSQQTHVVSNAEEYLGRMLWEIPPMRDEACKLWRKMDSRVSYSGWYIDEDGYEPHTYLSRIHRREAEKQLAAGETAAAQESLRLATWYSPYDPQCAMEYAGALMAAGKPDVAQTLAQPWNVTLTLMNRRWPDWSRANAAMSLLKGVPGLKLAEVPTVTAPGNDGSEDGED